MNVQSPSHIEIAASGPAGQMSVADWHDWLQKQEQIAFEEYRIRPNRLISDFNGEMQFKRDYLGREILELLQNANDAAAKATKRGRIHLELLPSGLIAANTGAPFSPEGVASLCLPHTSPKPVEGPQMIGSKGLGFRSVLNWTRLPLILSGQLSIAFSVRVAKEKQIELASVSKELHNCIDRQRSISGDLVVPLLAFPGFDANGDVSRFLQGDQNSIYARCRRLHEAGYDTLIGIPFDTESAKTEARKQLELLRPAVLLFASSVAELEIVIEGKPPKHWRHEKSRENTSRIYFGEGANDYKEWTLYSQAGEIPAEYLPPERSSAATKYEIVLAIPVTGNAVAHSLYSYFPTEVQFPYPLICHATLDLQANRQQPQETAANRFVISRLAEFMAQTAEILPTDVDPEQGLTLIAGSPSISDGLEKFGFRAQLLNAAKTRRLVPTLSDGLVTADKARLAGFPDTSWLPESVFTNVARTSDRSEIKKVLVDLGVRALGTSDWLKAGPLLMFSSLAERVNFIAGVITWQVTDAFTLPGLLLDEQENPAPRGTRMFLAPAASEKPHSLPNWFKIRFLHSGLRAALATKLKPKDNETFASMLAALGVARYSLDSLLSALVARANRRTESEPKAEETIRRELLQALWSLFPSNESKENRPRFPKDLAIFVPTKAGSYADSRTLYLTADYGNRGRILEDLYSRCAPEKLIAQPGVLGFETLLPFHSEFLLWLGVQELPREIVAQSPDSIFLQHVKVEMPEPVTMEDYTFGSHEEIPPLTSRDVVSIDALDLILANAPPTAVLAWLAVDNRAVEWKSPSTSHGALGCWPPRAHYARYWKGPIPSYVRWKLQTTKWLPTRTNQLAAPQECLMEVVQGIDKLLPVPARITSEQSQTYGVPAAQIRDAFDRAGVLPSFSQIDIQQLYDLLLSLPKRDPQGTVAKSIYVAVLKHFESSDVRGSAARDRFVRTGSIWARMPSGEGYCPVKAVRHIDSEDIPAVLSQRLNVAALPKRSGIQKVAALFGVRPVERADIVRRISAHSETCDSQIINDEIQNLKPMFLALRRSQRQSAGETEGFKQLTVKLCSSIEGEVEFQGHVVPLQLGAWDWIMDDQRRVAYVLSDPAEAEPLSSALLADAVGQVFAAVFRVDRGDDFARLFACKRKDRVKMLHRLVGDDEIPDMDDLVRQYSAILQDEDGELNIPEDALEPAKPSPSGTDNPASTSDEQTEDKTEHTTEEAADEPLGIDRVPHTPSRPVERVECRVSRTLRSGPRQLGMNRRITDGTFCEFKAMEFEENDTPPRFPVRVANVTGLKPPGVDVLSFASADDRAKFLSGDRSEARVARFIEVKGRSSEAATIDLRDNNLRAARKHSEKYFLYRLFDQHDGHYGLAILRNPINDATGAQAFYEIDLDAATGTEEFHIAGGISEQSYLRQFLEKTADVS